MKLTHIERARVVLSGGTTVPQVSFAGLMGKFSVAVPLGQSIVPWREDGLKVGGMVHLLGNSGSKPRRAFRKSLKLKTFTGPLPPY